MQTFETAAVISLVDHLSAPLRKLADHVGKTGSDFDKHVERIGNIGNKLYHSWTLPLFEVGKHMMDHALEFSKVENTLQGVLENRARTMKGLTQTNEEYARSQRKMIDVAADAAYKQTGGQSNSFEFHKSAMAGVKAGFDTESANSIATQAVNLALAGRIEEHDATDQIITLANSFGLKLKDEKGKALGKDKLDKAFGSVADLLATMSTNANMTEHEAFESLKLAAPLASQLKMPMAHLGAIQESLAEAGFKGSEAGVAMRSFMNAVASPKSTMVPMLANAGIDINKYRQFKEGFEQTPEAFAKYIKGFGYKVADGQLKAAFAKAQQQVDSGKSETLAGALGPDLIGVIRSAGKKASPVSPNIALKRTSDFFSQGVEKTDGLGLIMAMREANLSPGQLKQAFEGRQIPRLHALLTKPGEGENDPFDIAMKRMYGDDWHENMLKFKSEGKTWEEIPKMLGNAARLAKEHANDIEGAYRHVKNAGENLTFHLYKAGVFDAAARGLGHLSDIVDKIASQSPGMLRFEAGALALAAGIGPLLMLTSGMLKAGKAIAVLAEAISGLLGLKAIKPASVAAKIAAEGGSLTGTAAMAAKNAGKQKPTVGSRLVKLARGAAVVGTVIEAVELGRDILAERHKEEFGDPKEFRKTHFGPWMPPTAGLSPSVSPMIRGNHLIKPEAPPPVPSRVFEPNSYGSHELTGPVRPVPSALPPSVYGPVKPDAGATAAPKEVKVSGDVRGEATLMQKIVVEPSPLLTALVAKAEAAVKLSLSGKLGQTMGGSTGVQPSTPSGLSPTGAKGK